MSQNEATSEPDQLFAQLVHRQSGFVFRLAFAILRNQHDAEDVVQDTFLKVYRKGISNWNKVDDERGYLARVAWRLAVERRGRRVYPVLTPELASKHPTPEKSVSEADWNRHIHLMIEALPEELRDPLLLSVMEELTSPAIVRILGVPEGTVRNRLFRARQLLRQKIESSLGRRHER